MGICAGIVIAFVMVNLCAVLDLGHQSVSVNAQHTQWFYTGHAKNDKLTANTFSGSSFDMIGRFFNSKSVNDSSKGDTFLYCGATAVTKISVNSSTVDEGTLAFVESQLRQVKHSHTNVLYSVYHDIYSVIDYGDSSVHLFDRLFSVEVGLYDFQSESFSRQYWMNKKFGALIAVVFDIENASDLQLQKEDHDHAESASESESEPKPEPEAQVSRREKLERHWMVINVDQRSRRSVVFHTWKSYISSSSSSHSRKEAEAGAEAEAEAEARSEEATILSQSSEQSLSVMTYNLWHNNPPSWVWRHYHERWAKYDSRLRHFADVVLEEDPDILLLQEVRIDTAFVRESADKKDGGAQVQHLLWHLQQAQLRRQKNYDDTTELTESTSSVGRSSSRYHVAFQPAMNMINRNQFGHRNEEGIAIFSRYPIIESEVLLLPRELADSSDDHQRAVLRIRVLIGSNEQGFIEADFFTTHLSLSNSAREKSAYEIRKFVAKSATKPLSHRLELSDHSVISLHFPIQSSEIGVNGEAIVGITANEDATTEKAKQLLPRQQVGLSQRSKLVQIITGDLNAEPHETSIALLKRGNLEDQPQQPQQEQQLQQLQDQQQHHEKLQFVDVWHVHRNHSDEDSSGFTFPACDPVKRIDFIFLAQCQHEQQLSCANVDILDVTIAGQLPTVDTRHLIRSREGLGMLDTDSPTWASDHFAVATKLRIT